MSLKKRRPKAGDGAPLLNAGVKRSVRRLVFGFTFVLIFVGNSIAPAGAQQAASAAADAGNTDTKNTDERKAIDQLIQQNGRLEQQNRELEQQNRNLEQQNRELLQRINSVGFSTSSNSSTPAAMASPDQGQTVTVSNQGSTDTGA